MPTKYKIDMQNYIIDFSVMEETLKYIKVLNWGYGGFAPMTLEADFAKCLQQAQERLGLLDSLDYGKLLGEAQSSNGKTKLQKYQSTNTTFEYGLHFMRNTKKLLDMVPNMLKPFKSGAKKLLADGVWTFEQYREYVSTLGQIETGFEDRFREFATAYEYSLDCDDPNQKPNKELKDLLPEKLKTDEAVMFFQMVIETGLIEQINDSLRWKETKQLLAYFAERMSKKFNLTNGIDKDGNIKTSWKPFETLFGEKDLKGAKQNWMRLNTKFEPTQYEKIDALF